MLLLLLLYPFENEVDGSANGLLVRSPMIIDVDYNIAWTFGYYLELLVHWLCSFW